MSAVSTHKDPSKNWLIFFFVCFVLTVVSIGVYAFFFYNVNAPEAPASGGGHGMILPQEMPYSIHVA